MLCEYSWLGNVRELKNLVERLARLTENFVHHLERVPDWIQEELKRPEQPRPPGIEPDIRDLSLRELENLSIQRITELSQLKKAELAKLLGISRTTLWKRLFMIWTLLWPPRSLFSRSERIHLKSSALLSGELLAYLLPKNNLRVADFLL